MLPLPVKLYMAVVHKNSSLLVALEKPDSGELLPIMNREKGLVDLEYHQQSWWYSLCGHSPLFLADAHIAQCGLPAV